MNQTVLAHLAQFRELGGSLPRLWWIPLFPAIGAFVNGLFGARIQARWGKKANHAVAIGAMALAALTALWCYGVMWATPSHRLHDTAWTMIHIGSFRADFAFELDNLSGMMALIITFIGTGIHVYSTGYMESEKAYWRFFCYLNLFVFSMLLLVLGDSFVMMFFGWEGVGLCSYLLIGFWYTDRPKASAGLKAFVVNRVGDFGFTTGVFILFWALGGVWPAFNATGNVLDEYKPLPPCAGSLTTACLPDAATQGPLEGAKVVYLAPAPGAAAEIGRGAGAEAKAAEGEAEAKLDAYQVLPAEEAQGPGAPKDARPVVIGPTVVFHELADQLSIADPSGARPFARQLTDATLFGVPVIFLICLGLFIGACGKSAQIPLYVWLPDAMAGPTPVSALIHAATMVTAGVYMIARCNFLFSLSPGMMTVVACVGVLTALVAATIGIVQYDIKKVLAYSTVSQLGYMFLGVGVGAYFAGVFHLLTHAFFKACLFLGSGSVIHAMHFLEHGHGHDDHHDPGDAHEKKEEAHSLALGGAAAPAHGHGDVHDRKPGELDPESPMGVIVAARKLWEAPNPHDPQDMRNMGGLAAKMPITRWTYLAACWAIAGFPWAAGFYSKDNILGHALTNQQTLVPGWILWAVGLFTAALTSFYMFRSYYMTFYGRPATREIEEHAHESPRSMTYVLVALAVGAVLIGPLLGFQMLYLHRTGFEAYLDDVTFLSHVKLYAQHVTFAENGAPTELALMCASFGVATLGWFAARSLYFDMQKSGARLMALKARFAAIHRTLFNKYYVDEVYLEGPVVATMDLSEGLAWTDNRVVDGFVNGAARVGYWMSQLAGLLDRYVVDFAVNGIAWLILTGGKKVRKVQTGRVNNYAFAITAGVVVLVILVAFFK